VKWDPAWGEERIANMIDTRPDWCISRQRIWGVPIAVFLCTKCQEPLRDCVLNQRVLELFEKEGVEVWHTSAPDALLPHGAHCTNCGGTEFRRETDILDVWFDSGSSWHAVLEAEPGLEPPADLYFEGGDQYRGWFHTSLLTSVGVGEKHASPYKMVGTAGWTLDEQGRAMSKSLGNGVDPVDIADRLGAEIVRLWVASVDFREDVVNSEHIMQRLADNYRKLRNTFRFLLGNLSGFAPASDAVSDADLLPLDRYMLAKTRELVEKVSGTDGHGGWYGDFQFHRVYQAINEFCIVDLSAFYLDVLKDRLYTFAPQSVDRRSAQTVLWRIAEALVRLVAPILTFTSDEVWQYLPAVSDRPTSVHLSFFPKAEELGAADPTMMEDWQRLLEIREIVLKALETERKAGKIGKALEAKVKVVGTPENLSALEPYAGTLKELLNVSQVELKPFHIVEVSPGQLSVSEGSEDEFHAHIYLPDGTKCSRCWNYYPDDSPQHVRQVTPKIPATDAPWSVCGRCENALAQMGTVEVSR
jgi:isoleucyl-tRNA synthetase